MPTQILNWSQRAEFAKMWKTEQTAGLVRLCLLMGWNMLRHFQFGSNPDQEQNRRFGTIANTSNNGAKIVQVGYLGKS